ncbi:PNN [Linum perenne]
MSSSAAAEKTEEELRKEIDELHRQQRQITERLRDPRGIRRGGLPSGGPRNFASNGAPHRGLVRPADRNGTGDQPPAKKRLLSAVFKVEDGEIVEDDVKNKVTDEESDVVAISNQDELKPLNLRPSGRSWNQRSLRRESDIPADNHIPRVLPKNEDPSLVSRNKRMLGQLLGTLEKFRKEDMKLSGTEAYTKRSNALQKAEQRAREESERLRLEEREKIAEKRRRDLVLRARVAAKAEEKKLELLFLRWAEHQKKLSNFIRTKAEPPIYYMPKKPLEEDATMQQQRSEQVLILEWKAARREEVTEYQKQIEAQYLENVEKELERLEHGPKTRKIPGGGGDNEDEDEDEVEDINVGEDENDMMDDMLVVEDKGMKADDAVAVAVEVANTEGGNGNGSPISKQQQLE